MPKRDVIQPKKKTPAAKAAAPPAGPPVPVPLLDRFWARLLLVALSVGLLTLAFAPAGQFYLAYVGLVPWLVVVRRAGSACAAFLWSWLAGIGFFAANMWWLVFVSGPGVVALVIYLALYWAFVALVLRGAGLLAGGVADAPAVGAAYGPAGHAGGNGSPVRPAAAWVAGALGVGNVLLAAAVWAGAEWVRGVLFTGLPWLFLGHTQTPFLPACQIADALGVYGVSFLVVAVNVVIAVAWAERRRRARWVPAAGVVAGLWAASVGYGAWRMGQDAALPGPIVMVVQANYPQDNSGNKGASYGELFDFHLGKTKAALKEAGRVDLVVWSETMMPPVNPEARQELPAAELAKLSEDGLNDWEAVRRSWEQSDEELANLSRRWGVSLLTGGEYFAKLFVRSEAKPADARVVVGDKRNAAFYYTPGGGQSPVRYDKIHLVPFGEYTPFKTWAPWIYKFFLLFNPYPHPEDNDLAAGAEDALTAFPLSSQPAGGPTSGDGRGSIAGAYRFVVPICFEDIDAGLVARMFRPHSPGEGKRADFIINITNDGWFRANEMPQHLQAAAFRSIENRVPTARSVNTGISGFIDPVGRTSGLIAAGTIDTRTQRLTLDARLTLYTRFGDVFAVTCAVVAGGLAVVGISRRRRAKRRARAASN